MKTVRVIPSFVLCILLPIVSGLPLAFGQDKPDWQKHIDWSIGNHTTDP